MVFDAILRFRLRSKPDNYSAVDKYTSESPGNGAPIQPRRRQDATPTPTPTPTPAKPALLTIADLPPWRDPNPFILTGYRRQSRSLAASFASWLYWHNESCNIYSHLIPGTVLLILLGQGALYDHVHARRPDLEPFDAAVLALQAVTAAFCFLVSAAYHTLVDHSPGVAHRWLQLDYVGIIALILGNFVSGLHFGFYCTKPLKYFYWALILFLGSATATLLLIPRFRGPEWRSLRLASFVGTGLSAFAPIGHASWLWGLSYTSRIGVPYYLLEGLFLVIGCFFWERRIPERLAPGKFDFCGHSHTVWHVFVALSVVAHICGLVSALDYVYDHEWCRLS